MRRTQFDSDVIGASGGGRLQSAELAGELSGDLSATERGRLAEACADAFLVTNGYRVVLRNIRPGTGELDIIAYDGDTLCFVEVKWRAGRSFGGAAAAVSHRKRQRLRAAAAAFVAGMAPKPRCRFDVVAIEAGSTPRLLRAAFR